MSTGRILDPRLGKWILDTTVVNNFHSGDVAGELVGHLSGRVYLTERVEEEVRSGPSKASFGRYGNWYTVWPLMLGDADYQRLVQRFSVDPTKNRGEAESIIVAERNGLIFATDDGFGHAEAVRRGIRTTRTPAMLVSFARRRSMSSSDAWSAYRRMISAGRKFGELPWKDEADFHRLCSVQGYDT